MHHDIEDAAISRVDHVTQLKCMLRGFGTVDLTPVEREILIEDRKWVGSAFHIARTFVITPEIVTFLLARIAVKLLYAAYLEE